jgi:hypothetical protein
LLKCCKNIFTWRGQVCDEDKEQKGDT